MKNEPRYAITVQSLSRSFGEITAVDRLSFQVRKGEIFGLLGPNGAGKTTAINLVIGLLRRDQGQIRVLGFDPGREAREVHRRIGLVPQETNVYLDLNALDNLLHHAALYCDNLSNIDTRMEKLLRLMNLWERRRDPLRTYSGGMKRRLALARTLLHNPEVIFFDEPTLGVDVQGRFALWDHIQEQRGEGKTFLVSTNDMAEADALCDRVLIIDRGKAIALDSPENLKSALGRDIVTLRTTPPLPEPGEVFAGLGVQKVDRIEPDGLRLEVRGAETIIGEMVQRVSSRVHLESLHVARPSLDDVFLHHTGRALRE